MRLSVIVAASDKDDNVVTTRADCHADADEYVDRREMLLALGDQARHQFDILRGAATDEEML